jgi:small subunit ribosomal protein S18
MMQTDGRGYRGRRSSGRGNRPCREIEVDYKEPEVLSRYVNEYGRIKPRRQTGLCAKSQRRLALAVKRARHLALLPFVAE